MSEKCAGCFCHTHGDNSTASEINADLLAAAEGVMGDELDLSQLTEERDRLRAALQGIVTAIDNHHPKYKYGPFTLTRTEIDAARAALEGRE